MEFVAHLCFAHEWGFMLTGKMKDRLPGIPAVNLTFDMVFGKSPNLTRSHCLKGWSQEGKVLVFYLSDAGCEIIIEVFE